jgi:hypothetical protein
MRAKEFIKEEAPYQVDLKKELQKDWMPDPSSMPIEKDWRTDPGARAAKERGQALQQPPVSPEDLIGFGLGALSRKGPGMMSRALDTGTVVKNPQTYTPKDTVGKIKDIGYDLANKPSPYNPLTAKNLGREQATARYHADKAFRKEFGMNPPSYSNIDKEIQQFGGTDAYRQASKKYTDISNDFLNRGYQIRTPTAPEIGTNVGAQVPTKISRGQPSFTGILDRLADKSLRTGVLDPTVRSSALSVADTVADTVADAERKKNEFIANQFKEFGKDFQDRKKEQNKGKGKGNAS